MPLGLWRGKKKSAKFLNKRLTILLKDRGIHITITVQN